MVDKTTMPPWNSIEPLGLNSSAQAEWRVLVRQTDPELRAEGLLSLAGRQAQRNHPEIAASIYADLLEDSQTPVSVRERAQTRFDALRGEGEIGTRAEVLLNRFVQEATEPTTLLAMTVAGAAFRATRFLTLTRLASSPSDSLLTRGLGARALAGLTGFGVEATVFPLAGRMGNLALGREQEWSRQTLGRELASSFLMLGALKVGGLVTGSLAARPSLLRPLIQQGGMFGGIVLGHELEVRVGLRQPQSGTMTMIDSLSTLLQFNVAGRLNQGLMGEGMRGWEMAVEMRTHLLGARTLNPPLPPLFQRGVRNILGTVPSFEKGGLGGISPELASAGQAVPFGPNLSFNARLPDQSFIESQTSASGPTEGRSLVEAPLPPRPTIPELSALRDGRSRSIDRAVSPNIRIIEGQGVFWVIDGDTQDRRRSFSVRVGEELLPPGGSLRVRAGDLITLGSRTYRFTGAELPPTGEITVRRSLNLNIPRGEEGYRLFLPSRESELIPGTGRRRFAAGPNGETFVEVEGSEGPGRRLRIYDGRDEFRTRIEVQGRRWVLDDFPIQSRMITTIFLDWLTTEAYVEAASLEIRGASPELRNLMEYGLIQDSYSQHHAGPEGRDFIARPRSTLLPPGLGERHRAAADRAFVDWSERRLGFRVPTLSEIEAGQEIPSIDRLGVDPKMESILRRLVRKDTRFLEVGYGGRLETLQAVERLGGRALGRELNATYPPDADPAELRQAALDVLFLNGSPFLFFAGHQISLPGAFDLLRPAPRAQTLLIQAYNPRTPFEILRHVEELHGLVFEPVYYRPAASLSEPPLFPTDWCQRPDTRHAVLVARRPGLGL